MSEQTTTTVSIKLDDMTLEQLVQVSQGIGHEIEKLRAQRAYLRDKIAARLAAGERTSTDPGDAEAPGAVIDTTTA